MKPVKVFRANLPNQQKTGEISSAMEDMALVPRASKASPATTKHQAIPADLLENEALNAAIAAVLPSNYDFEVHKTLHFIRMHKCRKIALQMPEGLLMHATAIAGLIETFCDDTQQIEYPIEVVILAEVTYGACCIDDFTARALDCDLLVHYGHSCLIPITTTLIRTLYVFVNINFNLRHLVDTIKLNFPDPSIRLAIVATIQFASGLQGLKNALDDAGYLNILIPQARPLSPGEVLGCTSPRLVNQEQAVLYA